MMQRYEYSWVVKIRNTSEAVFRSQYTRGAMGLGQYNSLGEYCGPHTASSVFLILVFPLTSLEKNKSRIHPPPPILQAIRRQPLPQGTDPLRVGNDCGTGRTSAKFWDFDCFLFRIYQLLPLIFAILLNRSRQRVCPVVFIV